MPTMLQADTDTRQLVPSLLQANCKEIETDTGKLAPSYCAPIRYMYRHKEL